MKYERIRWIRLTTSPGDGALPGFDSFALPANGIAAEAVTGTAHFEWVH